MDTRVEKAIWGGVEVEVLVSRLRGVRRFHEVHAVRLPGPVPGSFLRSDNVNDYSLLNSHTIVVLTCTVCERTRTDIPARGRIIVFPYVTGNVPYHYFVIDQPKLDYRPDGQILDMSCSVLCPRCRLDRETAAGREFDRKDEQAEDAKQATV